MEDFGGLAKKFHLQIETYKHSEASNEGWLEIVTCEKYWLNIVELSVDTEKLREFFASLSSEDREGYLQFGIACFCCFVQTNFTGPQLSKQILDFLQQDIVKNSEDFAIRLSMNGEDVNPNTMFPVLLVVGEAIFGCCIVNDFVNLWWSCRALMVHQDVLDELSPTLLSNADRLHKLLESIPVGGSIKAELDIELAQLYLKFRHVTKSKNHITSASEILGVQYKLVGKLGKRTRHQEQELAQLAVNISLSEKDGIERPEIGDIHIPKNLSIEDDVRLNQVAFAETDETVQLPNTEQKLLLLIVQQDLRSKPADELQSEELMPFLEAILNQKNTYSVRVMALLLRCKFESGNRRTIERCLKQCESIIASYKDEKPDALSRVGDVFGVALPPCWKVEAQFAEILLNIGLVKNSLEVYLRNKLWEEVIVCYTILKMKYKAAELIRALLEIDPTVKLMCLLGDVTDDVTCYVDAWEMSRRRSYRAQRHWGQFLFERKEYLECIPHFEKSLSINPLQSPIWLRLGFAALQTENWQTAATAYRRYTTLEPECFEAWNNLAQAYIHLDNKRSAHHAVLEAIKCNFENWKVWENLLVISYDICKIPDVIRAYHKLLDLKGKYLNLEVLVMLTYGICDDIRKAKGEELEMLQKTIQLLARLTGIYPINGAIWELYAHLAPSTSVRLDRLHKAYKGYYATGGWDETASVCVQLMEICKKLLVTILDEGVDLKDPIVNSVKLNVASAVNVVKSRKWDETAELVQEVTERLEQLKEKLQVTFETKTDTT